MADRKMDFPLTHKATEEPCKRSICFEQYVYVMADINKSEPVYILAIKWKALHGIVMCLADYSKAIKQKAYAKFDKVWLNVTTMPIIQV